MSLYDKASLALIPSGYKAGTTDNLYSVLPANGDGDFNATRGSSATRVNKDGLIESVVANTPRLDYPLLDGVVQSCPALLLEPSRTNLITYSEDFSNAAWSKTNATITANDAVSPDGNTNAYKYTATNATNYLQEIVTASNATYTFSIFVKKVDIDNFRMNFSDGVTGEIRYVFNLTNQTSTTTKSGGTISDYTTRFEDYGNSWYRLFITATTNSGTAITTYIEADNETGSFHIYGAQLEAGSYATSYIPTEGSSVTRSVDSIQQSGFQGKVMNSTQGTIFIHFDNPMEDGDNNDFHMFRTTGTSSITDGFLFRLNTGTGVDILERVSNATGAQFSNIVTKGQKNKIAISFTSSTFLGSGNGVTKSYSGTYLGTEIDIDEFVNSGATEQGFNIIEMRFYDTALTQDELNALTS